MYTLVLCAEMEVGKSAIYALLSRCRECRDLRALGAKKKCESWDPSQKNRNSSPASVRPLSLVYHIYVNLMLYRVFFFLTGTPMKYPCFSTKSLALAHFTLKQELGEMTLRDYLYYYYYLYELLPVSFSRWFREGANKNTITKCLHTMTHNQF